MKSEQPVGHIPSETPTDPSCGTAVPVGASGYWRPSNLITCWLDLPGYVAHEIRKIPLAWLRGLAFVSGVAAYIDHRASLVLMLVGSADSPAKVQALVNKPEFQWNAYWSTALVGGAVFGVARWFIGAWWYQARMQLCGDKAADLSFARNIFMHTELMLAVPVICLGVLDALSYPNEVAAFTAPYHSIIIFFVVASFWCSFRMVCSLPSVSKPKAAFWFLILPLCLLYGGMIYAVVLGLLGRAR